MRVPLFQVARAIMCILQIAGCSVGSIKSPSNGYEGVSLIWEHYPHHNWCFCAGVPGHKLLIFLKFLLHKVRKKWLR